MGVQACRLPALKLPKPLKPLKTRKTLKTFRTHTRGPSLPFARPSTRLPALNAIAETFPWHAPPRANRHPKATHQWFLLGVQACRLPALKPLKPLKTLKTLKTLPTGTPRPHINGFLWASKPAVCQRLNP